MDSITDKQYNTLNNDDISLYNDISTIIINAKINVVKQINSEMTNTYFMIGECIVFKEQNGKTKAEYGKSIIKNLSIRLTNEFGSGYSERRLREMRQVYLFFGIRRNQSAESTKDQLSWSSYLLLSGIKEESKRNFYYLESINSSWIYKELKRQVNSAFYERLALSVDKEGVKKLSIKGAEIEKPQDIIKSITVLEFLNLQEKSIYSESELEQGLINNLENFLLELGRGFTFVKRQYSIKNRDKFYHADLVFYNRILQCFMIIDLKINELKHADIGQMLMYVNYFDQEVKEKWEKPTIGLLLCLEKDDFIVKYTLNESDNIYASEYKLILPNKEELENQIRNAFNSSEE